ncbi:MAG: LptE family protein [Chlorobiaceae bacterium]
MLKKGALAIMLMVASAGMLQGCYSFSGGSLPGHLKSISIPVFDDRSGAGIAQFRGELTRALTDRIESQSGLRVSPSAGRADGTIEGAIVTFSDEPSQLSSKTDRAATNRIAIVVHAVMTDRVRKTTLFSQSFAGFADYPSGNFMAQQQAVRFALGQIVDSMADRVVSGW